MLVLAIASVRQALFPVSWLTKFGQRTHFSDRPPATEHRRRRELVEYAGSAAECAECSDPNWRCCTTCTVRALHHCRCPVRPRRRERPFRAVFGEQTRDTGHQSRHPTVRAADDI